MKVHKTSYVKSPQNDVFETWSVAWSVKSISRVSWQIYWV